MNLDFRQAVKSPKNTFLQLKLLLSNITFKYLGKNSPNYLMSFLKL